MLSFHDLTYKYSGRSKDALKYINAEIAPGICLLLGENGAGKSTLLGVASGLLLAGVGSVDFDGKNPGERAPSTMSSIFYLSEDWQSPFSDILTTARYHGSFYPSFDADMLAENLGAFGLSGKERLKSLSLGMRRKSYIAYALALRPDLLLLDEPANGLDIDSKKELRRMVSRCIGDGQTMVISTHTVADLEVLYDSVVILHRGEVVLSASVADISAKLSFVTSSVPVPDAVFMESEGAMFRAIIRADQPYASAIDFELLYSAVVGGQSNEIIEILEK